MIRFTLINTNDLVIDQNRCSEIVNEACARTPRSRPVGLLKKGDNIIVCLEQIEADSPSAAECVFAPFPDPSEDGVLAEIKTRYYAGFSMVGFFETDDLAWALFEKRQ